MITVNINGGPPKTEQSMWIGSIVQYVWPCNITDCNHLEIHISHLVNKGKWEDECLLYGTIYQCWEMGTSFTELTTRTYTVHMHMLTPFINALITG